MQTEKRTPRFRRVKPPSFQLTKRDVALMRAVYDHRLLDSNQIVALVGGSAQQVRRRLKLLFNAGHLDRPRVQVAEYFAQPGTNPMVYALGTKGAAILVENGCPDARVDWSAKNRSIRHRFLKHTLLVADIMVAFSVSCRMHGNVRLIPFEEILATTAPERTKRMRHPQTWRVTLPKIGSVGLTPDKIFGLEFQDRPEGKNRVYFFLEADRGTMPVERSNPKQTSFDKKLRVYHETYRRKLHTERFGIKNFRVLTVTTSKERVATMVRVAGALQGLQGLFLFAEVDGLATGEVLAIPWINGRGEQAVVA